MVCKEADKPLNSGGILQGTLVGYVMAGILDTTWLFGGYLRIV